MRSERARVGWHRIFSILLNGVVWVRTLAGLSIYLSILNDFNERQPET
jgi:hypothetical protein